MSFCDCHRTRDLLLKAASHMAANDLVNFPNIDPRTLALVREIHDFLEATAEMESHHLVVRYVKSSAREKKGLAG